MSFATHASVIGLTFFFALATGCSAGEASTASEADSSESNDSEIKKAAPMCGALNSVCTVGTDTCCSGTVCIEYTVYDYPRCRAKLANGEWCASSAQCKSASCVDGVCVAPTPAPKPAPTCGGYNTTCVVGSKICCPGLDCVEYTVYDYPRCR